MLAVQSDGPEAMCGIHPASREAEVLGRLVAAVAAGVASRAMQAVPHLSLLSDDFYQAELRPPLCSWLVLWMRRQGLRDLSDDALRACLDGAGADEVIGYGFRLGLGLGDWAGANEVAQGLAEP